MRYPRVLHVVTSTDRRGAETAGLRISEALCHRNWDSDVVALTPGESGGLDIEALGTTALGASTLRSLRDRLRRAELVVAHGSTTLPAVAAASIGTQTPFVYRSIGDPVAWIDSPSRRFRVRVATSRARAVVALWREAAVAWHSVLGVPAAKVTVIPNGVVIADFPSPTTEARAAARRDLGLDGSAPVALFLGALSREKRVDLAIEAAVRLDGVRLLVAGDGPERFHLESLSRGAGDRVRFLGQVASPQGVLAAADVLLLPSATEGQPAVAIEAALSGVPVVAARVGGLAEIVQDGKTGLLVPAGDLPALTAALTEVLDNRSRFGDAGRDHCATRFAMERVADEWDFRLRRIVRGYQSADQPSDTLGPMGPRRT